MTKTGGNVWQPPYSDIPMYQSKPPKTTSLQPSVSRAHNPHTTVSQWHSSRRLTNSGTSPYSIRSSAAASGYSVKSAIDRASCNTPSESFARNGAAMQSSYQSHNLVSCATLSAPSSASLSDYTYSSNAYVDTSFISRKTSLEKVKIMSTIVIVFIISTIIISLYID